MELDTQDIKRLYGRHLFVISEQEVADNPVEVAKKISEEKEEIEAKVDIPNELSIGEKVAEAEKLELKGEEVAAEQVVEKSVDEKPVETPVVEQTAAKNIEQAEVAPLPAPLSTGMAVNWKLKSQSRIALVMAEAEFKNRAMTIILKDCVERAQVSTDLIGFGVLEGEGNAFDFSKQPTDISIAFAPQLSEQAEISLDSGKRVFIMPTVTDIVLQQTNQQALIALLQQINQSL